MKVAVILTAYDKMTRVIKQATDDSTRQLKKMQQASMDSFTKGAAMTAMGVGLAAPLVMATQKAIAFEDKMADVAKVMNLTIGSEPFTQMGKQALDLAVKLRVPTENAAGLMASLAQGGVVKNDLMKVSQIAGEMGVAFGMGAELAGEKFIKMKNALNVTIDETKKVSDAINYLSDNTAAKAEQIVTFMSSGGASVANTLKISGQDIAAFGATMISMGKSGEEAATIMERFQKGALSNAEMRKKFTAAGGGTAGLMAILQEGSKLKGAEQFAYFNKFGQYGVSIAQMANNLGLVQETLGKVSNEQNFLNSVQGEFINRTSTSAGKIQAFKTQMERLSIITGNIILPMFTKFIEKIGNMAAKIGEFAGAHPGVMKLAIAILAIVSAATIALGIFNILKGVFLAYKVAVITVSGVLKGAAIWTKIVTAAQWLFNAAVSANPIGLIIIAVAALVAGLVLLVRNWKEIVNWVKTSDNAFAKLIRFALTPIVTLFTAIKRAWTAISNAFKDGGFWNGIKQIGKSILSFILAPLEAILRIANKLSGGKIAGDALKNISNFRNSLDNTAQSVKVIEKSKTVTAAVEMTAPKAAPAEDYAGTMQLAGAGGGGSANVNFNVQVTGDGNDVIRKLKEYEPQFLKFVEDAMNRNNRKKY